MWHGYHGMVLAILHDALSSCHGAASAKNDASHPLHSWAVYERRAAGGSGLANIKLSGSLPQPILLMYASLVQRASPSLSRVGLSAGCKIKHATQ